MLIFNRLRKLPVNIRPFSTTEKLQGKRNFRKFIIPRRGSELFKKSQEQSPDPRFTITNYGVREAGYREGGSFVTVPECIPEIIVPDLTGFELKPYVSYRVPDVVQSEFTPRDLFNSIYSKKIVEDFKTGQLDENGNPLNPTKEESLSAEEAKMKARQTGSDIFTELSKRDEEDRFFVR